ncbi:MAG: hypothetical protein ACRDTH_02740 [Pseudonocardiaceae bacterium]
MATLLLKELHCKEPEDNIGGDHVYIKVGEEKVEEVWGRYRIGRGERLQVGVNISFGTRVAIELWDADAIDPDDILGRHVLGSGVASGRLVFDNDESDYDLTYDVT